MVAGIELHQVVEDEHHLADRGGKLGIVLRERFQRVAGGLAVEASS